MSEYQYYQFERLEGHLDSHQRQALREISSRADITTTSFSVHYNYGDLKAAPCDMMLRYFDIGFFYAEWGAINVYIKLPRGSIPCALLQFASSSLDVKETEQSQLLVFSIEDYFERFSYFDGEQRVDFFQHLARLRNELMQGDWRILYFMWTQAIAEVDALGAIPMIDFDYNRLTSAQAAFVDLFGISLVSMKALALTLQNHPSHQRRAQSLQLEDWLKSLSEADKNALLSLVFEQGQLTRQQAFAITSTAQRREPEIYQYWLTTALMAPYIEQAEAQLKQAQAKRLEKIQAKEKAEKEAKLLKVYAQREHYWRQAQVQVSRACASGYDQASNYLHLLAEAYPLKQDGPAFEARFEQFIDANRRRRTLLSRLVDLLPKG
ncbi:hypothetical protein [Thiomicrospira microaerophila]|uniref:hypothetical protein n=1 Tax=Thiomicrospira microaerophila TaxID=406020 RepID=UPI0005CAF92D|nr:hypothetical protein [Thiomicrospira microaerophila]